MGKQNEDTVLLDWFERYWKQHDDCPVGLVEDGFFPYLSGTYPAEMSLRDALRAARKADDEERGDE